MKKKVVFISGPTASGKTSLAVGLARKFNGEIISADSRQIYIGLDIGTGKDLGEYKEIKYHLIDICLPEEKFTLFNWLDMARGALSEIWSKKKNVFAVGGTGLYVKALCEGYALSKTKGAKKFSKKFSRAELEKMPLEVLQKLSSDLQLTFNESDYKNPRRLVRAIEREQEGIRPAKSTPDFDCLVIVLNPKREKLYSMIDKRVDDRFKNHKMLEEVAELIKSGVDPNWLEILGLEYKFISKFLISNPKFDTYEKARVSKKFQEMTQELKFKTHNFARRQLTWLKKQQGAVWIEDPKEAYRLVDRFLTVL